MQLGRKHESTFHTITKIRKCNGLLLNTKSIEIFNNSISNNCTLHLPDDIAHNSSYNMLFSF